MSLAMRLGRGETPGWIYSPQAPGFFFTGGYCCRLPTAKFTVLGGLRQGAIPIANAEQFFEETWSVLTPVPSPARSQAAGATYRGAGLHIGGTFTSPPYFSSQVDRLWQGTWNVETSLPAPRYAHAAASVGDAVYVVGGRDQQQQTVDTLFEYRDGTWSTKTSQPGGGRAFGNAIRYGGGFVSVGGLLNSGLLPTTTNRFNSELNLWETSTALPSGGRHGAAGFTQNTTPVLVGGTKGFGLLLNETLFFDGNTWSSGAPLSTPPRYSVSGEGLGATGHIAGGIDPTLSVLNQHQSLRDSSWTMRTPLLNPARYLHATCATY